MDYTPQAINTISEKLSRHLVMAKSYENTIINHGVEKYIYAKAMTNLLKEDKKQYLMPREKITC